MKNSFKLAILPILISFSYSAFSSTLLDLKHKNISSLKSFQADLKELRREIDFNKTLHIRLQQTYLDYPVWGADIVLHIPQGSYKSNLIDLYSSAEAQGGFANGFLYQFIEKDLVGKSTLNDEQANKVAQIVFDDYLKQSGKHTITNLQKNIIVFIDHANKAHWAYHISFEADPSYPNELPAQPHYIIDAQSFEVYDKWDNIQTVDDGPALTDTLAGGYGGNQKMGQLTYDGTTPHLPALSIRRDNNASVCYFQNADIVVNYCISTSFGRCGMSKPFSLPCDVKDSKLNLYWNGDTDARHGGYSPSNDALYTAKIVKNLYENWYHIPVLVNSDGQPMYMKMVVHIPIDNAYWNGSSMNFGDGVSKFYPLTSLGVAAHEISHGFTAQHSGLIYKGKSGGMNEAFSDMAAKAAEFFAYGHNNWQIGSEVIIGDGALRYMDWPSKDCPEGASPGDKCSINFAQQYQGGMNVHHSSGVYNRFFYLLSNTRGWNVKKAFNVMVQANRYYWTKDANFNTGACGVLQAAKDYKYKQRDVTQAFAKVGIEADRTNC